MTKSLPVRSARLLAGVAFGAALLALPPILGVWPATSAQAQYIVAAEFREALSPYGRWQNHARWGEVWIVDPAPADWRPYTHGRWVYTDEWGWYWDVGPEEAQWGWVTYHYGRWVHDPDLGWLWIPGEQWAPAWVDWRYGEDYVGWAPLPPDELLVEYRDDPLYWAFVQPRYLLAPRVYTFFVPLRERVVIIRRTKIVNRTAIIDRDRGRGRAAVNSGINPGVIARATGKPIHAAKVQPVVLRGTKVDGARVIDANEGKRARAFVKQSDTVIRPTTRVEPPQELGGNDKGRLGDRPPKAAQDIGEPGRRSGDQGGPPSPPVTIYRGGFASPPPPTGPNGRSNQQQQLERRAIERDRIIRQSPPPPPPPPVVRRPPPAPALLRPPPPPPPPAVNQRPPQDQRGNRPNRQPDERIR